LINNHYHAPKFSQHGHVKKKILIDVRIKLKMLFIVKKNI